MRKIKIRLQLIHRSYESATEDDLFQGISDAVTEDNALDPRYSVAEIMRSWTRQSGFPLLNVTRDYHNGNIFLSQDRYFNNALLDGTSDNLWWIPYNFISSSNVSVANSTDTIAEYWLNNKNSTISHGLSDTDWILFNRNATGYYRVMYDKKNYELLANALKNDQASGIDALSRSQLLDDLFSFIQSGRRFEYDSILDIMQFLSQDTSFTPWYVAERVLDFLNLKLVSTDQYKRFEVGY